MAESLVPYALSDGYIGNWLVAGPQEIPLDLSANPTRSWQKQEIAAQYYTDTYEAFPTPVERGPLETGVLKIGDYTTDWRYTACDADHLVDVSGFFTEGTFARTWAFTHLFAEESGEVEFSLLTENPVDVWVNKKLVFHSAEFPEGRTQNLFLAKLSRGTNRLLVRMTNVANPKAILAMALQITQPDAKIKVNIPTLITSLDRRNELEFIYNQLYLEREIHATHNQITLVYPETIPGPAYTDVRLQTASGRIYGQAEDIGKPNHQVKLGSPPNLPGSHYRVLVMPRAWEFYESEIRLSRTFQAWSLGRQRYSTTPYSNLTDRKKEALRYAATVEGDIYSQFALIALDEWAALDTKGMDHNLATIHQRQPGSEIELLGWLGLIARYQEKPQFSDELKAKVKNIVLGDLPTSGTTGESDQAIVALTCQILAGQLYAEDIFTPAGITGAQVCATAIPQVITWMRTRAKLGLGNPDSKEAVANSLTALSYLIDLAQMEEVWELASVLMDKLLFAIAVNSYNGVYGSATTSARLVEVKSGLLEPTAGITRVLWGMGVYNYHLAGIVAAACMENYELPTLIAEISAQPQELLNKEQQALSTTPVNKITYRTASGMLSSLQSYRPGETGGSEQAWQATLGSQCTVFTNFPDSSSDNEAHTPNFWIGNAVLPRIAQCKDTLAAVYNVPENSLLDYSHAYFPTIEFDEYSILGNTVFGRKEDGYIALTAANGLQMVTTGKHAYREIRSPGRRNIWVCQMGSSAQDGDYQTFQSSVMKSNPFFGELQVDFTTIRGDTFSFGWETPFMYNKVQQSLTGYAHFENTYTTAELDSAQMDITDGNFLLRLKFDDLPSDQAGLSQ
jgi:hypothetical protein